MFRILALLVAALLVWIDQIIKGWVVTNLIENVPNPVITGLFNLTFIKNDGASFGILKGKTLLLIVLVSIILVTILTLIISGKIKDRAMVSILALIVAGGAGNLIDRVSLKYVVDYLDFSAILGFPVFNFADCCVVCGTFLMLIYTIRTDIAESRNKKAELREIEANDDNA